MSLQAAITQHYFLMGYADSLTKDLSAAQFFVQAVPGMNHPAWIIGHLANTANNVIAMLGGEKILDESWKSKYGGGSTVSTDPAGQPSREELLDALHKTYTRLCELANSTSSEKLAEPNPNDRLRNAGMTTYSDFLTFILTGHVATHLGQLSAFRRTIGLPPLF